MKLIGGILPFIGWRWVWVDTKGEPCDEHGAQWFADAIEVEWFGCGVLIYVGRVYPREYD